ncbi:hypothetical protein CRM22_006139 [Opisthorchis felineus]|nr:hypothetical protein CRM22_006139 [Opisthorchis felineus]
MLAKLQPLLCSFARGLSTKPWKVTGLNHVAMVVPDVEKAATFYRDTFGVQVDKPFTAEAHGVHVAFVHMGNTKIELISPIDEHSPVAKFLERNKSGGLHHICVEEKLLEALYRYPVVQLIFGRHTSHQSRLTEQSLASVWVTQIQPR